MAGLIGGYLAMDRFMAPPDRAQVAIDLFTRYCLPLQQGELHSPASELVRLDNIPMRGAWGDEKTGLLLRLSDLRCAVSDLLDPLTPEDRARFQAMARDVVAEAFPQLRPDLDHSEGWDLFLTWIEHDRGDPRYWVVTLTRFAASGEDSATSLEVILPPE